MAGVLRKGLVGAAVLGCTAFALTVAHDGQARRQAVVPIRHVVVIYQENHSFDNVLGKLCAEIASGQIKGHNPCDGATSGRLPDGTVIPLKQSPDAVPTIGHNVADQLIAIDDGKMDGFAKYCGAAGGYKCYTQFAPTQIPNLAALAERFALSDRTFELATTPSWGGHMVLASATLDGFLGNNPVNSEGKMGWGCDSDHLAPWWNGTGYIDVPSCVPDKFGHGPFKPSPVPYVPTIFDRLDGARLTWKIYGGVGGPGTGYGWTICPTFFECLGSSQRANLVPASDVLKDARAGTLPAYSIVTPTKSNSQHNGRSMAVGDNWIGSVVGAIMNGPNWSSTAIFITYDDCGCFYDHVPPFASGVGIRVPMVIVSPYARAGFTDSQNATYASILAYVEHLYRLQALNSTDANAYDFSGSFNYQQPPLPPVQMVKTTVSRAEQAWLRAHPPPADDPT